LYAGIILFASFPVSNLPCAAPALFGAKVGNLESSLLPALLKTPIGIASSTCCSLFEGFEFIV
jgi:hypothetical protein